MPAYFIEGLFIPKKCKNNSQIEPFARTYWTNTPEEALQMAHLDLQGWRWTDGPRLGVMSEEKRMREQGAPELPGFELVPKRRKKETGR
jgi:hypothetical protein